MINTLFLPTLKPEEPFESSPIRGSAIQSSAASASMTLAAPAATTCAKPPAAGNS